MTCVDYVNARNTRGIGTMVLIPGLHIDFSFVVGLS
jgi:hypothetical protein